MLRQRAVGRGARRQIQRRAQRAPLAEDRAADHGRPARRRDRFHADQVFQRIRTQEGRRQRQKTRLPAVLRIKEHQVIARTPGQRCAQRSRPPTARMREAPNARVRPEPARGAAARILRLDQPQCPAPFSLRQHAGHGSVECLVGALHRQGDCISHRSNFVHG